MSGTSGTGIGTSLTGGSSSSGSGLQNVYNYNPSSNLTKWRAALAKVRSKSGNARICCFGDSTVFGAFSNGGSDSGDLISNSWPTRLSNYFNNQGDNATWQAFIGCGASGAENRSSGGDARINFGSNWQVQGTASFGGSFLYNTGAAGTTTFTPTINVDTFKIWYIQLASGSGTFSYAVNGGTASNVSTTGTAAFTSVTVTTNLGANTLDLAYVSGSVIYIMGIEAWNSNVSQIIVTNAGYPAATASQLATNSSVWNFPLGIQSFAPDLTIIEGGINDWNASVALSSFSTSMQTIITKSLAGGGDCVILTPIPSNPGFDNAPATAVQQSYVNVLYQLAASNNITLIDVFGRWQSYAVSNALGYYGNGLHPNQKGYADQAQLIIDVIGHP